MRQMKCGDGAAVAVSAKEEAVKGVSTISHHH